MRSLAVANHLTSSAGVLPIRPARTCDLSVHGITLRDRAKPDDIGSKGFAEYASRCNSGKKGRFGWIQPYREIRTLGLLLLFNKLVAHAGRKLSNFVPYSRLIPITEALNSANRSNVAEARLRNAPRYFPLYIVSIPPRLCNIRGRWLRPIFIPDNALICTDI